jgi:hypothetical protein
MDQLFIKRSELHQSEEYIKSAVSKYGNITNIIFFPKTNEKGHKYNGALIDIEFNYNDSCKEFISKLDDDKAEFIKMYHNPKFFWLISRSKNKPKVDTRSFESLQDKKTDFKWEEDKTLTEDVKKYLDEMKCIINKLTIEKSNLEKRLIVAEQTAMKAEHGRVQEWLYATDRDAEIVLRDCEIGWLKDELEVAVEVLRTGY